MIFYSALQEQAPFLNFWTNGTTQELVDQHIDMWPDLAREYTSRAGIKTILHFYLLFGVYCMCVSGRLGVGVGRTEEMTRAVWSLARYPIPILSNSGRSGR